MPEPKKTIAPKPSPRAVMRSLPPEVRLAMVEMPRDHRCLRFYVNTQVAGRATNKRRISGNKKQDVY